MYIDFASGRPVYQYFYSVAGRLLFVETLDLRLLKLILPLLDGWQLTPISFTKRSPDIRINVTCGETPLELPRHLNQFEIAGGGRCYSDGVDLYLALRDSMVHLRSGTPVTVDVALTKPPGWHDPLLATITSFAVCAALRRFGIFDLHSAGVVNPNNDKGVLIIGPSGSGKSTLTLKLGLTGWPYLSDDNLLLRMVGSEVEARGFRSFFAVRGDRPNTPYKNCFEPEGVFESPRRKKITPGLLLFIRLSDEAKTRLVKLTQAETMARLIRACPWATYDTAIASANLEVLSALARQATGFNLSAGRDLLIWGRAAQLLSRF